MRIESTAASQRRGQEAILCFEERERGQLRHVAVAELGGGVQVVSGAETGAGAGHDDRSYLVVRPELLGHRDQLVEHRPVQRVEPVRPVQQHMCDTGRRSVNLQRVHSAAQVPPGLMGNDNALALAYTADFPRHGACHCHHRQSAYLDEDFNANLLEDGRDKGVMF